MLDMYKVGFKLDSFLKLNVNLKHISISQSIVDFGMEIMGFDSYVTH